MGNDLYGAFGRDFTTKDGERIMLVAITSRQWKGTLETLAIGEAVAALEAEIGADFAADEGARFTHRGRLFPIFEEAFGRRTLAELAPLFEAAGVCWGPYQPLERAMTDPRLYAGNPLFSDLTHPSGETYPAPGFAATLPQDERAPSRPAPRLGEHTDEVLSEVLGMSSHDIAALRDAGVVG
jgi:2-methylfumaryl-CoA isomerase